MLLERLAHHLRGESDPLVAQTLDLVVAVADDLLLVLDRLVHLLLDLRDGVLPLEGGGLELASKRNHLLFCLARRVCHGKLLLSVERARQIGNLLLKLTNLRVRLLQPEPLLGLLRDLLRGEVALELRDAGVLLGQLAVELVQGRGTSDLDGVLLPTDLGLELRDGLVRLGERLARLGIGLSPDGLRTLLDLAPELVVAHLAHELGVVRLLHLKDRSAMRARDVCHDSLRLLSFHLVGYTYEGTSMGERRRGSPEGGPRLSISPAGSEGYAFQPADEEVTE